MKSGKTITDFTAYERQPWTNYVNNEHEYLIIGAIVHSEYPNIRYLHLIITGTVQNFVWSHKKVSLSRNHVSIASINLRYFTLESNNQKE